MQRLDRRLGDRLCARLSPWGRRRKPTDPRRILCVKFWGLGSLTLLTPAVEALRRRWPTAQITFLTLEPNVDLAKRLRLGDQVLGVRLAGGRLAVLGRVARLLGQVRRSHYDVVVDFEFFVRFSALLAWASGAPRSLGFWSPEVPRGDIHTDPVPFLDDRHVAHNFLALIEGHRSRARATFTAPRIEASERAVVAALLHSHGWDGHQPLVVLNPHAGRLALERRWPVGRFAALADRLGAEDQALVTVIGAPGEEAHARQVVNTARHPLLDLSGQLSMGELLALLDTASLVVSCDSGPMHLASAVGTPVVGLFGPETPKLYAPLGSGPRRFHWEPPSCSPCINVHDNKFVDCLRGFAECMSRIGVEEVLTTSRELLEVRSPGRTT